MASQSWPSLVESAPRSTFQLMLPTRCRHAIESSRHGMTQSKGDTVIDGRQHHQRRSGSPVVTRAPTSLHEEVVGFGAFLYGSAKSQVRWPHIAVME